MRVDYTQLDNRGGEDGTGHHHNTIWWGSIHSAFYLKPDVER
jgi:hypothetical protein